MAAEAVLTIGHRSPISGFITLSFFLQGSTTLTLAISKHGCTAFDPLSSDRKCTSHLLLFPALYDTLLRGKKILESSENHKRRRHSFVGSKLQGKSQTKTNGVSSLSLRVYGAPAGFSWKNKGERK